MLWEDPTCHRATKALQQTPKPVLQSLRAAITQPTCCSYWSPLTTEPVPHKRGHGMHCKREQPLLPARTESPLTARKTELQPKIKMNKFILDAKCLLLLPCFSLLVASCNIRDNPKPFVWHISAFRSGPSLPFQPQLPMLAATGSSTLSHTTVPFNSFSFSQSAFRVYQHNFQAVARIVITHFAWLIHSSAFDLHIISSEKAFLTSPTCHKVLSHHYFFSLFTLFIIVTYLFVRMHSSHKPIVNIASHFTPWAEQSVFTGKHLSG